ncbi:hypothetical protein M2265_001969 [Sphingobacterium kitahiroshimense]|jgi:hypothetical protein|nr:hypothetical protein [Sphingobacterium kitahiroshimense]
MNQLDMANYYTAATQNGLPKTRRQTAKLVYTLTRVINQCAIAHCYHTFKQNECATPLVTTTKHTGTFTLLWPLQISKRKLWNEKHIRFSQSQVLLQTLVFFKIIGINTIQCKRKSTS